ncbi:MAG: Allergen V5/Tpx related [Thermoleophilia bacterium]|nr:Allergen V5/Tpx related [Thermoleophilia bacterium]
MCGMSATGGMPPGGLVAGASGGGPPQKAVTTDVAGAKGGGPAADGAAALGGGNDLASAVAALAASVKVLADIVSKMNMSTPGGGGMAGCDMMGAGHGVLGVQGKAATKAQYVAPVAKAIVKATSANGEDDAFEAQVLSLINAERAKAGLGAVTYNSTLDTAAEKHAGQMSTVGKMAHDNIGDGDPGERIRAEGFSKAWGENVATGQTSPEQVVREWMASPEHRRNILDPNFRQMGVGYVTAANGRSYWAQEFGA